jgi:hypothetical protein
MMATGMGTTSSGTRGDELQDVRQALRFGQASFDAVHMARALDRLDAAETRLRALTRPEAVDFRDVEGETHVVLRCRACLSEVVGPTQSTWLAAPPAPCE